MKFTDGIVLPHDIKVNGLHDLLDVGILPVES
jgi:hypothetical protein